MTELTDDFGNSPPQEWGSTLGNGSIGCPIREVPAEEEDLLNALEGFCGRDLRAMRYWAHSHVVPLTVRQPLLEFLRSRGIDLRPPTQEEISVWNPTNF